LGTTIQWSTISSAIISGSERGKVDVDVALTQEPGQPIGHVTFFFNNPAKGANTCDVQYRGVVRASCSITQGNAAQAEYLVRCLDNDCYGPRSGTDRSDDFFGTSSEDLFNGKGGNDIVNGMGGNDKLSGGEGKDLLKGGDGNDELTGGPGPDIFQCGPGNDKITDFNPSEGDKKTNDCEQF
jgi:hypothetical protein